MSVHVVDARGCLRPAFIHFLYDFVNKCPFVSQQTNLNSVRPIRVILFLQFYVALTFKMIPCMFRKRIDSCDIFI